MNRITVYPQGSRPAEALSRALDTLSRLGLTREDLWLGGGATLAARWRHRRDESVSLFVRREKFDKAFRNSGRRGLSRVMPDLPPEETEGHLGWVRWETGHGKVGVFSSRPLLHPWLDAATETRHGLAIEKPASVLAKKFAVRFGLLGEILDRDLMDLVACARLAPDTLDEALWWSDVPECAALAAEIRHVRAITPMPGGAQGVALAALSEEAARIVETGGAVSEDRTLPEWMEHLPSPPRRYPPPGSFRFLDPRTIAPLDRFAEFTELAPFAPGNVEATETDPFIGMGKNMAGHPMSPTSEDIRDWLHEKSPEKLPGEVRGWMAQALTQMEGRDTIAFRQTCGASLFQIARMTHAVHPHGITFVPWLNRYAYRRAGDTREEVEGYGLLGNERWGA